MCWHMKEGTVGVYLELSVVLLFKEQKVKEHQVMLVNDMKLHSEEICAAVLMWYLGPKNRQRVFMCVCAWVCICIFFLHMGVIWSFVIPCLHTHTLLVFLCFVVFLFMWTKCTLARAKSCVVVVFIHCSILSMCPSHWFQTYDILDGPVTWINITELISGNILSVNDYSTCSMWVCLLIALMPDVIMFRGSVDCWLRSHRGELRTQLRPSEVRASAFWCMMSSAVVCLLVCFTGLF